LLIKCNPKYLWSCDVSQLVLKRRIYSGYILSAPPI
jgi:hypothetical protein